MWYGVWLSVLCLCVLGFSVCIMCVSECLCVPMYLCIFLCEYVCVFVLCVSVCLWVCLRASVSLSCFYVVCLCESVCAHVVCLCHVCFCVSL